MGKTLIKHCDVVTLNAQGEIFRGTNIVISGDTIESIGPVPPDLTAEEIIDGTGLVAVPGFWNAHTHAAMTFERSYGDDLPLDRWFNEKIWFTESALTERDVRIGAELAAAEMIRSGTVGFADHYFYMDKVASVVERSGLKALLAWCVFGLPSEVGTDVSGAVAFAKHFQNSAGGRIKTCLGPHAPYTCPKEFLAEIGEIARREELGVHIHLAESDEQYRASVERHGQSPVLYLNSLGLFDVSGPKIAAHCIAVDDKDIEMLAEKRVSAVQCPGCHMKLGMGVTPVLQMIAKGVNVALGTDGAASNNNLDMLEEAQLASLLQKIHTRDATALAGDLSLRMASQNGARAMGFENSGQLAPGFAADIVFFDFNKPHLRPRHSLLGNLLYSAHAGDIRHSMIAGKMVMKDFQILTLDEERILREAEDSAFAMIARAHTTLREYKG